MINGIDLNGYRRTTCLTSFLYVASTLFSTRSLYLAFSPFLSLALDLFFSFFLSIPAFFSTFPDLFVSSAHLLFRKKKKNSANSVSENIASQN